MDIGGTSGSGTSGDPYSELQHAMDSTSLGAGGTRFLVKGSQSVSSALSLTTHGASSFTQPVIIENWSGSPAISGGGTTSILTTNYDCIYWIGPLKLHTTGSNDIINMYRYS